MDLENKTLVRSPEKVGRLAKDLFKEVIVRSATKEGF